jgi:hypothetical protein
LILNPISRIVFHMIQSCSSRSEYSDLRKLPMPPARTLYLPVEAAETALQAMEGLLGSAALASPVAGQNMSVAMTP